MQVIGVYEGTKLIPAENHAGVRHEVHGEFEDEVNSYPYYALAECPNEYSLAQGSDGSLEAIMNKRGIGMGGCGILRERKNFKRATLRE